MIFHLVEYSHLIEFDRSPELPPARTGVLRLQSYDWPGNVRELQKVIERAIIPAQGKVLEFDLPVHEAPPAPRSRPSPLDDVPGLLTKSEMRLHERENLPAAMEKAHGKIKSPDGAPGLLGVKEATWRT